MGAIVVLLRATSFLSPVGDVKNNGENLQESAQDCGKAGYAGPMILDSSFSTAAHSPSIFLFAGRRTGPFAWVLGEVVASLSVVGCWQIVGLAEFRRLSRC